MGEDKVVVIDVVGLVQQATVNDFHTVWDGRGQKLFVRSAPTVPPYHTGVAIAAKGLDAIPDIGAFPARLPFVASAVVVEFGDLLIFEGAESTLWVLPKQAAGSNRVELHYRVVPFSELPEVPEQVEIPWHEYGGQGEPLRGDPAPDEPYELYGSYPGLALDALNVKPVLEHVVANSQAILEAEPHGGLGHNRPPSILIDPETQRIALETLDLIASEEGTEAKFRQKMLQGAEVLWRASVEITVWLATKADKFADSFAQEAGKQMAKPTNYIAVMGLLSGKLGAIADAIIRWFPSVPL